MELRPVISDPDNVIKKLDKLPVALKGKALRNALRKGANVWRDAARVLAEKFDDPDTPLSVAKFITTGENRKLGKREGGIAMRVGVRGGARSKKGTPTTPWYWRFKEFGTQKQRAEPFMRPAMESNLQKAADEVLRALSPAIDKIAREKP